MGTPRRSEPARRARAPFRPLRNLPRRTARAAGWLAVVLVLLLLAVVALDVFLDEPIRASVERRMNAALDGYSVRIGEADFTPWTLSLELTDLAVRQDAYPHPPVLDLAALRFSVQWRALLHLRAVADAELASPRVHVDLGQLRQEREDRVDLEERGWQEAVEESYPLEINELRVTDGSITYIDDDPERPLVLTDLEVLARNIRNVRSPGKTYPSTVRAAARVFESGRARLDGRADFLAEPTPAYVADLRVDAVPLERLGPVIEDYRLQVRRGELSARGVIEHGADRRQAVFDEVAIDGVHIDYLSDPELTRRAVEAATDTGEPPATAVHVERFRFTRSELGFVNRATSPGYRIYLSGVDATLSDWSNLPDAGATRLRARGAFMGSGRTAVRGLFRPDPEGADFELAVAVEGTRLETMNDLLRTYADLDVTGGTFSLYSEVRVAGGRIDGYVKPLFREVNVYEPEQDRQEGFFQRLWERIAEGLGEILENPPREEVVTVADLSGAVSDPESSNLQVVLNLIENAFFDAILPGFRGRGDED